MTVVVGSTPDLRVSRIFVYELDPAELNRISR